MGSVVITVPVAASGSAMTNWAYRVAAPPLIGLPVLSALTGAKTKVVGGFVCTIPLAKVREATGPTTPNVRQS